MTYPIQQNIDTKRRDKLPRCPQVAFEMRERRPGYSVTIVPEIIGALSGGMKKITNELTKILTKYEIVVKTAAEMQKTILVDSETLLRIFWTCPK